METTAAAARQRTSGASRQRKPFFAAAANVGNNTPDVIPNGGRDHHASRPCIMGGRLSAHTPLTRDTLRAERAPQISNAASTAGCLQQQQEESKATEAAFGTNWFTTCPTYFELLLLRYFTGTFFANDNRHGE